MVVLEVGCCCNVDSEYRNLFVPGSEDQGSRDLALGLRVGIWLSLSSRDREQDIPQSDVL